MKGSELVRKIKRLGRARSITVTFVARRGKGSHGTLCFGASQAVVPDLKAELRTGTLHAILAQLGLQASDLTE